MKLLKSLKKIDTYDLSILPFEDCCTIFTPPAPKTRPDLEKSRNFEKLIDVDALVKEAVDGIEIVNIKPNETFLNKQEDVFAELL